MGDLGWDGLLCALIPVAIVAMILIRAIVVTRRRRGADPVAGSTKDGHVQAYELGRAPEDPSRHGPGPGFF